MLRQEKKHHREEATPLSYRPDSLTSVTILILILMTVERQSSFSKRTQRNRLDLQTCFWMNHKTLTVNSSSERSESICSTIINQQDKDSTSPQPTCSREEEKLSCDLNSKVKCPQSSVKWSSIVKRLEQYGTISKLARQKFSHNVSHTVLTSCRSVIEILSSYFVRTKNVLRPTSPRGVMGVCEKRSWIVYCEAWLESYVCNHFFKYI